MNGHFHELVTGSLKSCKKAISRKLEVLGTFCRSKQTHFENWLVKFCWIRRKKVTALQTSKKFVLKIFLAWWKLQFFVFIQWMCLFLSEKLNSLSMCYCHQLEKNSQEIFSTFSFNQDSIKIILEKIRVSGTILIRISFFVKYWEETTFSWDTAGTSRKKLLKNSENFLCGRKIFFINHKIIATYEVNRNITRWPILQLVNTDWIFSSDNAVNQF